MTAPQTNPQHGDGEPQKSTAVWLQQHHSFPGFGSWLSTAVCLCVHVDVCTWTCKREQCAREYVRVDVCAWICACGTAFAPSTRLRWWHFVHTRMCVSVGAGARVCASRYSVSPGLMSVPTPALTALPHPRAPSHLRIRSAPPPVPTPHSPAAASRRGRSSRAAELWGSGPWRGCGAARLRSLRRGSARLGAAARPARRRVPSPPSARGPAGRRSAGPGASPGRRRRRRRRAEGRARRDRAPTRPGGKREVAAASRSAAAAPGGFRDPRPAALTPGPQDCSQRRASPGKEPFILLASHEMHKVPALPGQPALGMRL